MTAANPSDFLFVLEKHLIVSLQYKRPDLLFFHAAALRWEDKVYLFAGDSGSGKSTTAWALLHHGFTYLSDELAAVDLRKIRAIPYPHALCLKQPPPAPYRLPAGALDLGRTIHIPASYLPAAVEDTPCEIGGIFLLKYEPDLAAAPKLHPIGAAPASAQLYVATLNALAHPNYGIDAITHVASAVPCYVVRTASLPASCALILHAVEGAPSC